MPNKCSQPEKDKDAFIGLCNQLVKLEEKEPSRARSSTPSCQKNCNRSVCLLRRMPKVSSCLGFYILIIERGKKGKKKKKRLGFFYYYCSLLCLTECHQRTMTCYSGKWRHCWFYSSQIITSMRCPGHAQVLHRPIFKILLLKYDKCWQRKGSRVSLLLQYIIVMHFFFFYILQHRTSKWFKTHWIHRFLCAVLKCTNRTDKHIQVRLLQFPTMKLFNKLNLNFITIILLDPLWSKVFPDTERIHVLI